MKPSNYIIKFAVQIYEVLNLSNQQLSHAYAGGIKVTPPPGLNKIQRYEH